MTLPTNDKGLEGLAEGWRTENVADYTDMNDPKAAQTANTFAAGLRIAAIELQPFIEQLKGLLAEWRERARDISANQPSGTPQITRNVLFECADALQRILTGEST